MSRFIDKKKGEDRRKTAYNYFVGKGMEPHHAAGILGNLMQESYKHLDSTVENEIGAVGIAQWLGPRRQDLENFAKDKGTSYKDFDTQLEFLYTELMRTGNSWGSKGQKAFFDSKNAEEAAAMFVDKFERSGEKPGEKGYDNRLRNAKSIYLQYNDHNIYAKDENNKTVSVNPEVATEEQIIESPKVKADFYHKNFDIIENKFKAAPKEAPAEEQKAKAEVVEKATEKLNERDFFKEVQGFINKPVAKEESKESTNVVKDPYDIDITTAGNEFFNFFLPNS